MLNLTEEVVSDRIGVQAQFCPSLKTHVLEYCLASRLDLKASFKDANREFFTGEFKRRARNRAMGVSVIPFSEKCFYTSFSQSLLIQHTLLIPDAVLIVIMLELSYCLLSRVLLSQIHTPWALPRQLKSGSSYSVALLKVLQR